MADVRIPSRRATSDVAAPGAPRTAVRRGPAAPAVGRFAPGQSLKGRRFLIVTAPFGPFGRVLAEQLAAEGASVARMLFNAGDAAYWRRSGAVPYTGDVRRWPARLHRLVLDQGLTDLIVFGEGGPYNQGVLSQATKLKAAAAARAASDEWRVASGEGTCAPAPPRAQAERLREPSDSAGGNAAHPLRIWVLENGYFRPDWITVEENGVNASSGLPRDRHAYDPPIPEILPTRPAGRILPHHVINISLYHVAQPLGRLVFRRYVYPYTQSPWLQFIGHVRRYLSLTLRPAAESDAGVIRARGPFFIACLQREGDAQLLRYSHYADNTAFLAEVLSSFARHAPADARLVVKNHPLDPGLVDLARMTHILAVERGIADRVDFIDGGNLAALCRASQGMVVNNSSAALSALGFSTPVKVLGEAFFDIEGLTDQAPIDTFWARPTPPDDALFNRFKAHVIARTQVNGNYHEPRALKPTAKALARKFAAAR
ncbi:MAG: capsular biosynthesis protein [Brevundimonas sp.]|uniref:capsular biosynthesis protein n=1 Tax=Brevundimonas sp. TaxID=1871086 RepID=UPI002736D9A4|nr:capsular biosynthesis protein [Brevundimonas sp.]MDP3403353.1 capsular biosynthesis protein [Brevundimonas sp.]